MALSRRGSRRECSGVVLSTAMKKTIVVDVQRIYRHPLYGKTVRRKARRYAHDEREEARQGDLVRIVECRPMSKSKRWRLVSVLKKGSVLDMKGDEGEAQL